MVPRPAPALDWCFTLNNPDENMPAFSLKVSSWKVEYCVFQQESAGTTHFQGFVIFKKKQRFTAVVKLLKKAHWEKRKGTREEARDYCMKADTRVDGTEFYEVHLPKNVPLRIHSQGSAR